MTPERIRKLLEEVEAGSVAVDEAMDLLERLPFEDLGFAHIDHHRAIRQGFPEVVFCQGKTVEQVVAISRRIVDVGSTLLATRADDEAAEALLRALPGAIPITPVSTILHNACLILPDFDFTERG